MKSYLENESIYSYIQKYSFSANLLSILMYIKLHLPALLQMRAPLILRYLVVYKAINYDSGKKLRAMC